MVFAVVVPLVAAWRMHLPSRCRVVLMIRQVVEVAARLRTCSTALSNIFFATSEGTPQDPPRVAESALERFSVVIACCGEGAWAHAMEMNEYER